MISISDSNNTYDIGNICYFTNNEVELKDFISKFKASRFDWI